MNKADIKSKSLRELVEYIAEHIHSVINVPNTNELIQESFEHAPDRELLTETISYCVDCGCERCECY